ncbi:MAG: cofactor-independent phosphoglycerate mutase [Planctomycetes bacterium]|nr:cofactor-independent phosphoglycerate mutase [Planctomycetota bacterium]
MKYCIVIPDGAADFALNKLDGRTPLETARIPNMDRAAREGLLGEVKTVPKREEPGSDVAILSVLGYDPEKYYTGRAPLEAADLGVELESQEWGFRCNFITTDGSKMGDFCAGHISTEEANVLIEELNNELGTDAVHFYTGMSYRHLMTYNPAGMLSIKTTPPHQAMGEPLVDILPTGGGSKQLVYLMERSREILENHEINEVRRDLGQNPANMIWLWGEGQKPQMEDFDEKYGGKGAAISAVNLVRGIARLIGWDIIEVPGITGFTDTDYNAKGRYAIDALEKYDIVLVHIEASDEASHNSDVRAKVQAIEKVDQEIVGPLMSLTDENDNLRLMILPDHYTSVEQGRHLRGAVPVAMWGAGIEAISKLPFSEAYAEQTEVRWDRGHELMRSFLH